MSSIDIYNRALELAESGQSFVLAPVIVAQGSTPQKAGANAVFEATGIPEHVLDEELLLAGGGNIIAGK